MNKANSRSPESTAWRLASEFMNELRASGHHLRAHIDRLARLAVSEDGETAKAATAAIFASIIEPLADSFDPRAVSQYNRVFAQLIQTCRKPAGAQLLDSHLNAFGLETEEDLFSRVERLRRVPPPGPNSLNDVKLALVLSRVTLGADVAITSVIIARLKSRFPEAEIVLVGGRKAAELFGGDPRLSFQEIAYDRSGALIDRLHSWVDLKRQVEKLAAAAGPRECLIVDPDSRLTQLGLLPVACSRGIRAAYDTRPSGGRAVGAAASDYIFFPSREYGSDTSDSLGQLTARWLGEVFGGSETSGPRLGLAEADRNMAGALTGRLRQSGPRWIVCVNFGVGENLRKRVGEGFEAMLVSRLIEEGATVILDKGAGEDEARRVGAVVSHALSESRPGPSVRAIELDEERLAGAVKSGSLDARLVVWQGRVGLLAALIERSDLYIGYDSAGQHIAAALGVACIDVFAGFSSPRMIDRWKPTGLSEVRLIVVEAPAAALDSGAVLAAALDSARDILSSRGR